MEKKKSNNSGFSLLEVLIAVIILSIMSIPLIRSFGTVALTNNRARILQVATDSAENMMENIEFLDVGEMVAEYTGGNNAVSEDANGVFEFVIREAADLPGNLPNGYYMEVELDPTMYPNNNAVNIADVKSMSITDTAVYEMSPLDDATVYSKFNNWNQEASDTLGASYIIAPTDYFQKALTRYIDITITKHGDDVDANGNPVELVTVKADVRYGFRSASQYWRYLPDSQNEYAEDTQELFNNLSTKIPLAGIYLFYQPRAVATMNGNADVINVYNPDNIKANLFVAAQPGDGGDAENQMYYNATTGPLVTIEETWAGAAPAESALTLYTNLSKETPYISLPDASGDLPNGEILCRLTYQDSTGSGAKKSGMDAVQLLDGRDLDGKVLIGDNTKDRIYKVITRVFDGSGNQIVELDGTKLE